MRFRIFVLFFVVSIQLLASMAGASSPDSNCETLLENPFTPRQIEVLEAAATSRYQVTHLVGEVAGRTKSVVLLGEVHNKNSEDSQLGLDVLNEFKFRGLEGVLPADPLTRFYGRYHQSVLQKLAWITSLGKDNHGSTIDDAYLPNQKNDIRAEDEIERATPILNLPKFDFLLGPGLGECSQERTVNVLLEVGHKPPFVEKARMLFDPIIAILAVTNACQVAVRAVTGHDLVDPLILVPVSFVFLSPLLFQHFGSKALRSYEHRDWYKKLFAFHFAHLNARNETMVANLIKALERYPSREQILVIVGKGHMSGMIDLLKGRGFAEQSLQSKAD